MPIQCNSFHWFMSFPTLGIIRFIFCFLDLKLYLLLIAICIFQEKCLRLFYVFVDHSYSHFCAMSVFARFFFYWVNWVFLIELNFLMYFGSTFFISYKFCQYFLPVCSLPSHFPYGIVINRSFNDILIVMKLNLLICSTVIRIFILF